MENLLTKLFKAFLIMVFKKTDALEEMDREILCSILACSLQYSRKKSLAIQSKTFSKCAYDILTFL